MGVESEPRSQLAVMGTASLFPGPAKSRLVAAMKSSAPNAPVQILLSAVSKLAKESQPKFLAGPAVSTTDVLAVETSSPPATAKPPLQILSIAPVEGDRRRKRPQPR